MNISPLILLFLHYLCNNTKIKCSYPNKISLIKLMILSLSFGLLDATSIVSVARVVLDILGLPLINKT